MSLPLSPLDFFFQKISSLKGIGSVWNERLAGLGLKTFWDVLSYLPRTYEVYTSDIKTLILPGLARLAIQVKTLENGPPFKVRCVSISDQHPHSDKAPLSQVPEPLKVSICLIFFKKPTYPIILQKYYTVEGLLEYTSQGYEIKHPRISRYLPTTSCEYRAVYPLKHGVSSGLLRNIIQRIILMYPEVTDWIPKEYSLPSQKEALRMIHLPLQDPGPMNESSALKRLALDELLAQQLALQELKDYYAKKQSPVCFGDSAVLNEVLQRFGLSLTPSQQSTWHKIQDELIGERPMMRLLHGDVGSGKSIIAFLMLVQIATSGQQGGLLVPTEVLAHQHARALKKLLQNTGLEVTLWTGSFKQRLRGDIVVGTHTLFQEKSSFESLGGVVVDEQHKFGVLQRLRLVRKGQYMPHTLFMSATPIPRTLEMTLWGQVAVSRLEKRPEQRSVETYMVSWNKISELYRWIQRCLDQKEAVYWVCPWIEGEDVGNSGQVVIRYQALLTEFPGHVGMLHGKLSWLEKERVLKEFSDGTLGILVSTTAIEVGVHVDHASTMIIEESQRFGLAQLHQLRGRVGRGMVQGHCFLIWGKMTSSLGFQRLKVLKKCDDGFVLAQEDLRLRGAGSVCGLAQSGSNGYRFADLLIDQDLLEPALNLAKALKAKNDPSIPLILSLFGYHYTDLWHAG
ncbi:ATP-dependent DNA helicase RecG [Holospora curviuscula]|uniref:ATP-dependent DNA helicase RecG n=1 Tax=Holospora curviuscula TaxID=1082868 RepID=A0A2S5REK5_9PROT|nr:DEAD/DEAH box helicase [Holospora curviuscula]PPE05565.1 ATP-dependent DNA helicase RecG [Holospora curviuscula]